LSQPFSTAYLRLHYAYHFCYPNIHRAFLVPRRWSNAPNERPSAPGLPIDRENSTEQSNRGIVYFPAAALVALFSQIIINLSQIIANPSRPNAKSDILRINGVVVFLARVASQEQDTYMDYVLTSVLIGKIQHEERSTAPKTPRLSAGGQASHLSLRDEDGHKIPICARAFHAGFQYF
jgi:hypothetical protein